MRAECQLPHLDTAGRGKLLRIGDRELQVVPIEQAEDSRRRPGQPRVGVDQWVVARATPTAISSTSSVVRWSTTDHELAG
jgi:hypothetical protein